MAQKQPPACGELRVFVIPNASKNKLTQQADGTWRALVSAKAAGNRANKALLALVAKWAGLPEDSVSIVAGFRSRWKTVLIAPKES
jgi:uncharacterized protein YggU (UPF0235/DUF167 family)